MADGQDSPQQETRGNLNTWRQQWCWSSPSSFILLHSSFTFRWPGSGWVGGPQMTLAGCPMPLADEPRVHPGSITAW